MSIINYPIPISVCSFSYQQFFIFQKTLIFLSIVLLVKFISLDNSINVYLRIFRYLIKYFLLSFIYTDMIADIFIFIVGIILNNINFADAITDIAITNSNKIVLIIFIMNCRILLLNGIMHLI